MLLTTVFCEQGECLSQDSSMVQQRSLIMSLASYYKLPMVFRQGELALQSIQGRVDLRCLGLILQPMLEV